jgi:hypothetical protein
MPAFAILPSVSTCDREDSRAFLEISSAGMDYAQVTKYVDRAGAKPSECRVLVRNVEGEYDIAASVLLRTTGPLSPSALPGYTRARLRSDGETLAFLNLASRKDMGQACGVELVFKDDRWLLEHLPIRGASIAQGTADAVYSPLFSFHLNPKGMGNCVLVDQAGLDWKLPVFTDVARRNALAPAALNDQVGKTTFWTLQLAMRYLWYCLNGASEAPWEDLPYLDPDKIVWPKESLALFDSDTGRKILPDLDLNGWSALAVLDKLLDVSGDYGLRVYPGDDTSQLAFYPKRPGNLEAARRGHTLDLQREGAAQDLRTVYDFLAETDYSDAASNVVVEGAPFEIEAEFRYTQTSGTDTLEPAWDAAEAAEMKAIVAGDGTYASVLKDPGSTDTARTLVDGHDAAGKHPGDEGYDQTTAVPLIYAKTREAIQLAREHCPRAFRAYRLRYQNLATILEGYNSAFAAWSGQVLQRYRAILEEQLQLMLTTAGEQTDTPYPVRIHVSVHNQYAYHQVLANAGLRVTADGTLWFDGLTDEQAGGDNIYSGSFLIDPSACAVKDIRLNAVITHDVRVRKVLSLADSGDGADPNRIGAELDDTVKHKGSGPTKYILATGKEPSAVEQLGKSGYRVQHQVGSNPTQNERLATVPLPLSRVYRDDTADLEAHAARRFRDLAKLKKAQKWVLIGIRTDLRAGDWLHGIQFVGGDGGEAYAVNAPIAEVTYDFDGAQKTTVDLEA